MKACFEDIRGAAVVELVPINFNGESRKVMAGTSLAAALLREGGLILSTHPITQAGRAPYCLMGVCFECLVEVNGRQQRACMVRVKAGMDVKTL